MFYRLSRVVVILAAVQLLGGYWFALQSVAWIGMIAHYSRDEKLGVAIEKTFDGQHPCGLCKMVNSGRAKEEKQQVVKMTVQFDAVIAAMVSAPMPESSVPEYFASTPVLSARDYAPPTPPPRAG